MNDAALDRILQRLAANRGGQVDAEADGTSWKIQFPEDSEQDGSPVIRFRLALKLEGERLTGIEVQAALDDMTKDQTAAVQEFTTDLQAGLQLESTAFLKFEAVREFLVNALAAEIEDGVVVIRRDEDDDGPIYVSEVTVVGEPWVSLSTPFADEADPEWLLDQNGALTHLHFEASDGAVSLSTSFPLALLTGQRILELVDDLFTQRDDLLDELNDEGDDDE